jgi:ubiquitin-protein ligase
MNRNTATAIKRIIKDIKQISLDTDNGIYYFPSDDNMLQGYGLLIGTKDTPYHNGFYLIKFKFPNDYPYNHPVCTFITVSNIRHNPNLYENGKVCLSILGTWGKEDTWKPSMGIEQILLSIQSSVLTKNALDNEPPYDLSITDPVLSKNYEEIVRHSNFKYNVVKFFLFTPLTIPKPVRTKLRTFMKKYLLSNKQEYLDEISSLTKNDGVVYHCKFFNNTVKSDYSSILTDFKLLIKSLSKNKTKIVLRKKKKATKI